MINVSGNVLEIDSTKSVSFKYEIDDVVLYDSIIVVLLKVPDGIIFNENIFGVSLFGDIIWQIESIVPGANDSPYVAIEKDNDSLNAFNWSGIRARVKISSGKVAHKKITK